jgi:hypothetical protein
MLPNKLAGLHFGDFFKIFKNILNMLKYLKNYGNFFKNLSGHPGKGFSVTRVLK